MYVILGALGYQGEAILHYLYNTIDLNNESIIAIDVKGGTAFCPPTTINEYMFTDDCPHDIRYLQGEIPLKRPSQGYQQFDWIKGSRVTVINCLPTEFILNITKECISRGWNVIDLGGVTEVTLQQMQLNEEAKRKGVTVVTDCGLAPGISTSKAAELSKEPDVRSIKVYCGGIPKYPELPLSYSEVFYMDGVRKEYSGVAQEIVDGEVKSYPTLSGREYIPIPGFGLLEAARTSGGISVGVDHIDILNLSYKTLRYPGHWSYVEKYIMPQKDPTAILKQMVEPVSADNPDVIILAFCVEYMDGDEDVHIYFWEYDYDNGISAMAQATGFTAGAVARQVHENCIGVGVLGMHDINASEVIAYAKQLPNQYSETPIGF